MNVGFISLGCSKNLVDTEMAIGLFQNHHFTIVNNPKQSDIIVINTCGFIESAKEEAIGTILEMAEYKKERCQYLIVMGCLVERYKKELEKAIPEVDLFLSIREYDHLWKKIERLLSKDKVEEKNHSYLNYMNRVISTGNTTAYLKIAEGCSNRCTYCAIPSIRGPFISRRMEDVLQEAETLVNKGLKELIVIAQDTSKYGIDLYGKPKLAQLLEKLSNIKGLHWIRFLYTYPESITEELIQVVKEKENICKYFDIPIQHSSNAVLKRMNRKSNEETIRNVIAKIRKEIPEVVIRTTLMVGFPGETKEDFENLYHFVEQMKFDKLGVFQYSKEDGTPAAKLKEQIHPSTKKSRFHQIMKLQKEISKERLKQHIGNIYEVLIESKTWDGKYYIGRTYMDVPDIDGVVYVKASHNKKITEGEWVSCKMIEVKEYDWIGEIV